MLPLFRSPAHSAPRAFLSSGNPSHSAAPFSDRRASPDSAKGDRVRSSIDAFNLEFSQDQAVTHWPPPVNRDERISASRPALCPAGDGPAHLVLVVWLRDSAHQSPIRIKAGTVCCACPRLHGRPTPRPRSRRRSSACRACGGRRGVLGTGADGFRRAWSWGWVRTERAGGGAANSAAARYL